MKTDVDLQTVALHNDRSQYEIVLADEIKHLVVEQHGKNEALFDLFFEKPQVQDWMLGYLAATNEEFRSEALQALSRVVRLGSAPHGVLLRRDKAALRAG